MNSNGTRESIKFFFFQKFKHTDKEGQGGEQIQTVKFWAVCAFQAPFE